MEIKKSRIFAAIFFLLAHALCAQGAGYYMEYIDDIPRFIQRLEWYSEEYVLYYEVSILINENGYREYSKDRTEDNFILVSLPPGKYRYSVTPYDLLEIPCEVSEWFDFEVLPAFQPSIESFSPQSFMLDKNRERILYITGTNIFEESEVYLQRTTGFILRPESITITNNRRAELIFDDEELVRGNYDIYIINPGGLETYLGSFIVDYGKPLDFLLKLSWAPVIPIYGYMNEIFGPSILPAGLTLSFEAISSVRGDFNGGLELAASILFLDSVIPLTSDTSNSWMNPLDTESGIYFASLDLNIALQRRFNHRRMAFTFRFGIGVVFLNDNFELFDQNDIILQFNLGADFMMRIFGDFSLEAGVDLNNHITPYSSSIIKPKLGLVWQF